MTQFMRYARRFLCLVLLLSLTGCSALEKLPFAPAAKVQPCPGLKIGVLIGADDNVVAAEQRDGYEFALEQANADGGPAGCKLSLIYQPEVVSGSPNQVYKAVRSLVEEDQVIAILGGTSSTSSMFAAALVNRFQVPMLIPDASSMHVLPENNHWTFRVGASDQMYSRAVFEMIHQELGTGKTVGMIFESTTAGHDAAVTAAETAAEQEMTLLEYSTMDSGQEGYQAIIDELQAERPEVLYLIFNQSNQALGLIKALTKSGYMLPMTVVQGTGFTNQSFLEQSSDDLKALIDQMLLVSSWNGQGQTDSDGAFQAGFAAFTAKKYGEAHQPTAQNAMAYNSLRILQMAIRQGSASWNAASVKDVAAAREALRADLQAYRENTPAWGNIAFSTGGQNQAEVYVQAVAEIRSLFHLPGQMAQRADLP